MILKDDSEKSKFPSPDIFDTLSKEEQEAVMSLDSIQEFKKGDHLIKEGQYFTESYYVITGCVRQYTIKDGIEHTSHFYMEDEAVVLPGITRVKSLSKFFLECLEDSKISVVSYEKETEMCNRFPRFDKMCRATTQNQLAEFHEMFATFVASTPEERYKNILDTRPDLLNRVPQYQLASYLGVKPESLSRIRKRLSSKD